MGSMMREPLEIEEFQEYKDAGDAHLSDWRADAKRWYAMVSGEQWDANDKAQMAEQGKVPVAFNRLAIIINSVCGNEANNRQEVTYIPRTVDDNGVNSLLTDAARWVREQCDAEDEESDAFRDMLICGYGWTETRMDYTESLDGKVVIARRDPGCFRYDPAAEKRNIADARWIQCEDRLDEDEILSRWPGANVAGVKESRDIVGSHDQTAADTYRDNQGMAVDDDLFTVTHHCWFEMEDIWRVLDPSGQVVELSPEKWEAMRAAILGQGGQLPRAQKGSKKTYYHAFVLGNEILEQGLAPCQHGFPYECMTGYRDRNTGTFYGLVKAGEDPQKYANKMLSQLLHIINTNAKGGLMIEQGAVDDVRKLEENWAKTDGIVTLNAGAITGGKVQPKPIPQYPQSIPELMQFSVVSIRDSMGVNLEILGQVDRNQPGVLEEHRIKSGMTTLATLFDSLRQYRKRQGRLLAYFIRQYLSDGRLVRISGPSGERYVPLLRDPNTFEYDVIVDDAPSARDMKAKTFEAMMQLAPMVKEMGVPIPQEALDYSPLPNALVASWKEQIQQAKQNPPPPPPEVMVAQAMAQSEQMKAQIAQQKAQADIQAKQSDLQFQQAQAQADMQAKQLDLQIAQQQARIKEVELQMKQVELDMKLRVQAAELQMKEREHMMEMEKMRMSMMPQPMMMEAGHGD